MHVLYTLVASSIVLVAAIFTRQFFDADLKDVIVPSATFMFVILAFVPSTARPLFAAASFSSALLGLNYFKYVRQDEVGIGILVIGFAVSLGIMLFAKPKLQF